MRSGQNPCRYRWTVPGRGTSHRRVPARTPSYRTSSEIYARAAKPGIARNPLDPAEGALLVVTCGHLCFLPWALGAMHVWSQATSLILSCIGFGLAMLARSRAGSPALDFFRHPVLWAGLAWLGYMVVQASNPAWRHVTDSTHWWLEPVPHAVWAPSGVEAPFAKSNPWRNLMVHTALLLLAVSVWAGLRRRRSYLVLLTVLSGNALLLALLGLVQRWDGTARIFWSHWSSNDRFVASFIYPNHAGPYFCLMTALAAGLAWRFLRNPATKPAGIAMTIAAALSAALVIHTHSRMSILMLALFAGSLVVAAVIHALLRKPSAQPVPFRAVAIALGLAGLIAVPLAAPSLRQVWTRFQETREASATTGADRRMAWAATADMLRDRWLLGWGAGCFRHVFPLYAKNYPAIYETPNGVRRYWEHAHNDWLEIPAEMGVLGTLPALICLGWLAGRLIRSRCWHHPVSLPVVLGCALLPLHAWVDFVFQNPAVLFTWTVLLLAAIRYSELDRPGSAVITDRKERSS